ncbi:ABC transporter substrate-binding protein [Deinococcus sp. Marseille-Q6407]|uniref:ABC transporter substrate-binding protein n=1 Tax=Deinococcus sp. Marseille-Q6407 TaxID=2969223 RepID=UPI0021BFCD23|nr:ABC transporter substrate-binding protein [Deinococcus sp. Marseille-Q6407]
MKKNLLLLLIGTLMLAACNNKTETTTSTTTTAPASGTETSSSGTETASAASTGASGAATAVANTADTLIIQQSADIPTLDPGTTYDTSSGQVVENMYETLVDYDGASLNKMVPGLATKWEEGNGGKQYRFTMRDGVKFHTGNPMTCEDAKYTFQRNLVTNTSSSGNWFLSESLLGTPANANDDKDGLVTWKAIQAAVQCDGNVLVFNLPKVDPSFVPKLAYLGQGIVDSKHAKEIGEWDGTEKTWKDAVGKDLEGSPLSKDPSGTGPFKFQSRDANNIIVERFDGYWGKAPALKTVVLQIVPEEASRNQAFLNGDADVVEVAGGRPFIEQQLTGKPGIKIIDNLPNTYVFGISMNQKVKDPVNLGSGKLDGQGIPADFFKDPDVRKGFIAAFDQKAYIDQVQSGKGQPRNFMLPDTFLGYDPSLPAPQFDLKVAEEYFKKAWGGKVWENGFTINASTRQGNLEHQTMMEMIKQNVESLNPKFKINLNQKQWSDILADARAGKEALTVATWAPDYADPDNFVHTFYDSKGYYNVRTGINDPELDKMIDQARSTTDEAKRKDLYRQIAQRSMDQGYFIMMPTNPQIRAIRDNVKGVDETTYNPMRSFTMGVLWKNISKS